MNPLEQIKKGIIEMDWTTVCNGYKALTGEFLHTKQEPKINDIPALRQIYSIVATALEKPDYVQLTTVTDTKKKEKKKKVGRSKGRKKRKTDKPEQIDEHTDDHTLNIDTKNRTVVQREVGKTQFITNEPDPEEVRRNKLRAKKSRKEKIAIDRQVATTYDVKCNECECEFRSDRPGGEMGQKCKKCLSDKKSMFT